MNMSQMRRSTNVTTTQCTISAIWSFAITSFPTTIKIGIFKRTACQAIVVSITCFTIYGTRSAKCFCLSWSKIVIYFFFIEHFRGVNITFYFGNTDLRVGSMLVEIYIAGVAVFTVDTSIRKPVKAYITVVKFFVASIHKIIQTKIHIFLVVVIKSAIGFFLSRTFTEEAFGFRWTSFTCSRAPTFWVMSWVTAFPNVSWNLTPI